MNSCSCLQKVMAYVLIYLLNATGMTLGGSSKVHVYTQTIRRTKTIKQNA